MTKYLVLKVDRIRLKEPDEGVTINADGISVQAQTVGGLKAYVAELEEPGPRTARDIFRDTVAKFPISQKALDEIVKFGLGEVIEEDETAESDD